MSRLIKDQGVVALAKIILNLAETAGSANALKIVESSPGVFIDLLSNKNLISEKLENLGVPQKIISEWSRNNVEKNIEKLKLTPYQALILFSIIKYNNSATLDNLISEFEKRDINVGTGSMIGGSLAGISKKCVAYGIPKVFKTVKGKDRTDIYSIVPSEVDTLKVFQKHLKQVIDETA